MLTTHSRTPLAALTTLLLLGGAVAEMGAQPTTRVSIGSGTIAPHRIADCDITVESCGTPGGELYGPPSNPGSSSGGTSICALGSKGVCNVTTVMRCTQWHITGVDGDLTVDELRGITIAAGAKIDCQTWTTTTDRYYWT